MWAGLLRVSIVTRSGHSSPAPAVSNFFSLLMASSGHQSPHSCVASGQKGTRGAPGTVLDQHPLGLGESTPQLPHSSWENLDG